MTLHREAVATLAPLFRATDEPPPLILLGAGASLRSGVPTAAEAVKQIARLATWPRPSPRRWREVDAGPRRL